MIDQWFRGDLEKIYENRPVAVFIDVSGEGEFLLETIEDQYLVYRPDSEIEELHVKFIIERDGGPGKGHLIYTQTERDNQKFIREYCETNGFLEIRKLQNYVKQKVHQTLNLNINLPEEELIAAAKVSIGKNRTYWMDLCHHGATDIFDLNKELLPFVHDPQAYDSEQYDEELREVFYRKVSDMLDQEYIAKPPETLAKDVVHAMLDGLANDDIDQTLKEVYQRWLDSVNYRGSFSDYLESYSLPPEVDFSSVSDIHPFRSVDEQLLKEIGENVQNKDTLPNYIAKINRRIKSQEAKALGITFWEDVKTLLEFDSTDISYLDSFSECVEYYAKRFYRLDNAIRHLYAEFLNKRALLEPFQEYYKQMVTIFLDKWFQYFDEYQEGQTGLLQNIIDENEEKTAVIVGDGVAYEVAMDIEEYVSGSFHVSNEIILADLPSSTLNNMSLIYLDNGEIEEIHHKREEYLKETNQDKAIEFVKLDEVTGDTRAAQYLICTYKDIDDLGEQMQQKALKYFEESSEYFAKQVELLLKSGYTRVYLVSDHGFVLTGLLTEADKIAVSPEGNYHTAERYLCAEDKQPSLQDRFLEVEKEYQGFKYLYFSKTINPFKTPGVYGYSHGGASPQELIIPYFYWERAEDSIPSLAVTIQNKEELGNVTGEVFQVKLQAEEGIGDLFSQERKVFLVFFSDGEQINKSDVLTVKRGESLEKEYTFDEFNKIEVLLLDAETKEELDRAVAIQNQARDLGGLG